MRLNVHFLRFLSSLSEISVLSFLTFCTVAVLSVYIYVHDYGTMVPGKEGCVGVLGLPDFALGPGYIFAQFAFTIGFICKAWA